MGFDRHQKLRGFDSYELKLGDMLRGERASQGKSLPDVGRDLKIKAEFIEAIENADASAFPFAGFASGYVKSYARYLGLDPDEMYARFCAESGFGGDAINNAVEHAAAKTRTASVKSVASCRGNTVEDFAAGNRYLARNVQSAGWDWSAGLRGVVSIGLVAALVGGIGYGGWSMVENLQRVGFAPLPSAPDVRVSATDFSAPALSAGANSNEGIALGDEALSLAAIYATQEAPILEVEPRDGPISSINPDRAGIYAPSPPAFAPQMAHSETAGEALANEGLPGKDVIAAGPPHVSTETAVAASPVGGVGGPGADAFYNELAAPVPDVAPSLSVGVHVYATAEAWVRVRGEGRKVLFSGILQKGERFELPEGAANIASLRAGNAGAIYIVIDGHAFGPLGRGPSVAKNVSLSPESVRTSYPAAEYLFAALKPTLPERRVSSQAPISVALHTD